MAKAHELAKKQREIAVSEFFLKNRHLLGFDNPRKALLTVIKEGVDNSLTYDTPFLVRINSKIKIARIGEFIDNYLDCNKDKFILRGGNLEKKEINNAEVLAFNKELKLGFRKVSTVFRHKVNSDIYRLNLESSRSVDLTEYHSVFTLKNGNVVSVRTNELKEGDFIIVPRKEWGLKEEQTYYLNVFEELCMLPENLTENIMIYNVSLFLDEIKPQLKEMIMHNYRLNDFKRFDYVPFNLLRKCKLNPMMLNNCRIGWKFGKVRLPMQIEINSDFANLLGLYVAEGSTLYNLHKVYFSYGSHENELIKYTSYLIEKVFDVKPCIHKAHSTATNVVINSSLIGFLFKHVLGLGACAKDKQVSDVIFSLSKRLREDFLLAYLAGDGYPSRRILDVLLDKSKFSLINSEKITLATASYNLFVSLQYLLSSLSFGYSGMRVKGKKRFINGKEARFGDSYYLYIYTNQKRASINKAPIRELLISTSDAKLNYSINRSNQTNVYLKSLNGKEVVLLKGAQNFILGDLGVLRIKGISKINYDKKWVYDISVPDCENFAAGVGPIMCHNSLDACEEAKILPDIKVHVKQIAEDRFLVVMEDNGPGIVKEQIPKVFAKLLYGSKFHTLKQQRGQQGIGISAAAMYGQLTTGKATKIISKIGKNHPAHYFELHINTQKNEPEILADRTVDWKADSGTKIEIELEAKYQKGKQSVDDYLKQTAIANPHCQIEYINPEGQKIMFPRATDKMPREAKAIKPHPYGVEIGMLIKMMKDTKARTLQAFLTHDFSRVSPKIAKEVCAKAGADAKSKPDENAANADKIHNAIQLTKIMKPQVNCLSPIGEELIVKGLQKELKAEFYTAITRRPAVYRGNPFQIEVGISYGGEIEKEELIKVYRFANRVPLLYQSGACAVTKAIASTNWRAYGLSQSRGSMPAGPMALFVHIASAWVPFTSESKEAIAHYPEILKQMRLAFQDAGRELGSFIRRTRKTNEQKERINLFEKYIPEVSSSLANITGSAKGKIEEGLLKILKKSTKEILESGGINCNIPNSLPNSISHSRAESKQTTLCEDKLNKSKETKNKTAKNAKIHTGKSEKKQE